MRDTLHTAYVIPSAKSCVTSSVQTFNGLEP